MDIGKFFQKWLLPFGDAGNVVSQALGLFFAALALGLVLSSIIKFARNFGSMSNPDIDPTRKKQLVNAQWLLVAGIIASIFGSVGIVLLVGYLIDMATGTSSGSSGDGGDSSIFIMENGLKQIKNLNFNFGIIN